MKGGGVKKAKAWTKRRVAGSRCSRPIRMSIGRKVRRGCIMAEQKDNGSNLLDLFYAAKAE